MNWTLLIYTLPSSPSRLRASVWRDVKRAGAIYLRDGVCALPDLPAARDIFTELATRVRELGGRATMASSVILDVESARSLTVELQAARAVEYSEIEEQIKRFLDHVHEQRDHRDFTFAEVEVLDADFGKLKRWHEQVESRDYSDKAGGETVRALLERCQVDLAAFLEEAFARDQLQQ
jgi:hypothetical protein